MQLRLRNFSFRRLKRVLVKPGGEWVIRGLVLLHRGAAHFGLSKPAGPPDLLKPVERPIERTAQLASRAQSGL
jgi:hypothetical protein